LSTTKELEASINALRVKLGRKPYSGPSKKGAAYLVSELHDLQQQDLLKNPPPAPEPEPIAPDPAIVPVMDTIEVSGPIEVPPAAAEVARAYAEQLDEASLLRPGEPETIKAMSERLLAFVHHVDETDRRTVGLLYGTIVALVRKKFPKAETSIECLRWYAVHMRQEDRRLPQKRPRPLVRG